MSRTIIIRSISSAENSLEGLSELWTEDCVDDGVQCRVEISQPEEKTGQREIEDFFSRKKSKPKSTIQFCWSAHKISYLLLNLNICSLMQFWQIGLSTAKQLFNKRSAVLRGNFAKYNRVGGKKVK